VVAEVGRSSERIDRGEDEGEQNNNNNNNNNNNINTNADVVIRVTALGFCKSA
jgi:hypothetical protein